MDDLDALARACNPLNTDIDRLFAWRAYECSRWISAVRDRGLRLDDVPREYYLKIRDELRSAERDEPKKLRA